MNEIFPKRIGFIQYSLLSPDAIRKMSVAKIIVPELYDEEGMPVRGGLMDLRLGVVDPGLVCETCGKSVGKCPGHFGHLELARPVFHIEFIPIIKELVNAVCTNCGRVKLTEEEIDFAEKKIEKYRRNRNWRLLDKFLRKYVYYKAKKRLKCPHCGFENQKIEFRKPYIFYIKTQDGERRIFPTEIRAIFEKIPDRDAFVLGFHPVYARPEWTILTVLPIPPVTIRQSIILETGERSEDDLTHKLVDIVRSNQRLKEAITTGAPQTVIRELYDLLQYHISTYFHNNVAGLPVAIHRSGKPIKSLVERIVGKEGRIRYNLLGKRTNYSARAVISPDVKIKYNEVGVPIKVVMSLTIPERVTEYNIDKLKEYVLNGPNKYPGANYVIAPDGKRRVITEENKETLASQLEPGWIVERHILDGDIVLFLRYPSLHRLSMQGHYVKVLPGDTFRLHPAIVKPYNADFDGDEMNIFVPQSEEARAEAVLLLEASNHVISIKHGEFMVGAIQEAITGLYLLTKDNPEIPIDIAMQLVYWSGNKEGYINKLIRFIKKAREENRDYLTGYEIASVFLPDDLNYKDDKITIENGVIVDGYLDSSLVKAEKGKLFAYVYVNYGKDIASDLINSYFLLGVYYQYILGITMSISDLDLPEEAKLEINNIIEETMKKIEKIYDDFKEEKLERIPGKTLKETYQLMTIHEISGSLTQIQKVLMKYMKKDTGTYVMSITGARGDWTNITKMVGSLGFQVFRGKFIEFGYNDRNLSIFPKGLYHPLYYGWVVSSFLDGLKSWEMFYHSLTGRDSLMDTAIRTGQSGYFYRRLSHSLYELYVSSNLVVKDNFGRIVQFLYGDDGIAVHKTPSGKIDINMFIEKALKMYSENKKKDGDTKKTTRRTKRKN